MFFQQRAQLINLAVQGRQGVCNFPVAPDLSHGFLDQLRHPAAQIVRLPPQRSGRPGRRPLHLAPGLQEAEMAPPSPSSSEATLTFLRSRVFRGTGELALPSAWSFTRSASKVLRAL